MIQTRLWWYKLVKSRRSIRLKKAGNLKGNRHQNKVTNKETRLPELLVKTKTKRINSKATSRKLNSRKAKRAVNMLNGKKKTIRNSRIQVRLPEANIRRLKR